MNPSNTSPKIETEKSSVETFPWVGIGASAGGLDAFKKFISNIEVNSGMAYVIVQHLDPSHESVLPEILQKSTTIPVLEITDDVKVQPNHIYIIPSNKMLLAFDGVLKLNKRPEKSLSKTLGGGYIKNLPIDLFFTSLAEVHGAKSIGVILSGTASDGTKGIKAIKEMGGITIAQDEASATFDGMPKNAVLSGSVDFILTPEEMPGRIMELTRIMDENEDIPESHDKKDDLFRQILYVLRVRKGTDFTYYKQTTIRRRILRRMALCDVNSPEKYLKYLRENVREQDKLYQDLLIPVTDFFRDASVFEDLCIRMFPDIIKSKSAGDSLRVWVAGCSTGEEAYTIAICIKELIKNSHIKAQVFASDISEPAIVKARAGKYKANEISGLSSKHLQDYFTKSGNEFQVNKSIRDICVFAVHNFIKDPPFSKMDFISCRNALIYMEPYLQKKAITTFHYSLIPDGYLLLGKSETTNSAPGLFNVSLTSNGKNEKLFTRNTVTSKFLYSSGSRNDTRFSTEQKIISSEKKQPDFHKVVDEVLLSKFTPPGVVVNEAMEIVQFRGATSLYLEQMPGKPSHNLLKMAREGLAFELRNVIHKVKKEHQNIASEIIPIKFQNNIHMVSFEAILLEETIEPHYLIIFHDHVSEDHDPTAEKPETKTSATLQDEKSQRITQLEKELALTREDMHRITEAQEAANEELQTTNEELLSSSEELQSLNEELETGKEELQSTNEELMVVNQEIIALNKEVHKSLAYSNSIIATIHDAMIVMDQNMNIKQANDTFYDSFLLKPEQTEGKQLFELGDNEWDIPELRDLLEKVLPHKSSFKNFRIETHFSKIGFKILEVNGSEIVKEEFNEKLIHLAIQDLTESTLLKDKEKEMNEIFQNMVIQTPVAMIVLRRPDHIIDIINKPAIEIFKKKREVLVNSNFFKVFPAFEDVGFRETFDEIYLSGKSQTSKEKKVVIKSKDVNHVYFFDISYDPYRDAQGKITGVVTIWNDVTDKVLARRKIEESEKGFHFIADFLPQKVWTADANGSINYLNQRWLDFAGKTFEDLKGWGWRLIVHEEDWAENQRLWQKSIDTGKDFEFQQRFLDKDGEYKWHLSRAVCFRDENDQIKMWVGTNTEIQDVKEEEERRKNFIKIVSHELKTPVTSIQGYIQLLLMMMQDEFEPNNNVVPLKSSLERMDKLVHRLTRLITEMLDLARIDSRQMEMHKELFSLDDLVNEVVEDFRLTSPNNEIELYNSHTCTVDADKHQIEQVLVNLISNAVKYSEDGEKIKVEIYQKDDESIAVRIIDKGIGIDKQDHERIFDRFYRVSGKNEQTYPGFGIGLFISKEQVTRHGGKILLESELDKGSAFTMVLPCINDKSS